MQHTSSSGGGHPRSDGVLSARLIFGFTLWEIRISIGLSQMETSLSDFLASFDAVAYPDLGGHIQWHLRPDAAPTDEFAFCLELVLDGLERLKRRQRVRAGAAR